MLVDNINKFALIYLDNILVYSKRADRYKAHLFQVSTYLHKYKVKVKYSKCEFVHSWIKYLGHVVGSGELRVDPDKVSVVADWAAHPDI